MKSAAGGKTRRAQANRTANYTTRIGLTRAVRFGVLSRPARATMLRTIRTKRNSGVDLNTIGAALVVIVGLVLAVISWRRQQRRRLLGELAEVPDRVTNPRQFQHLKRIRVWQLEVDQPTKACSWARESRGKRFRTDSAVPLPIAGCGTQCRCRYQPVTENRRRKRRMDPVDQLELNIDTQGSDRRHTPGRRKEDNWRGERRS